MFFRFIGCGLLAALLVAGGAGCHKSETAPGASSPAAPDTIARVHWLGKKQLAAATNAATFMEIWNLEQSAALEAQTLDKLSLAPWRLLKGDAATNGAPYALLRPLLDDLVQEESYLEIRGPTNQPGELAFAIRLKPERAGLWQTNLAAVLESLTGVRPEAATGTGWSLKKHDAPNRVELTRAGDWTLVGLAQETNALLADFLDRIRRDHAPFAARATNFWVEAEVDLLRVSRALALGWNLPAQWPRLAVSMIGDGKNVNTRGQLDFAAPLNLDLKPWNIPTNLVHDPLVSFMAVRGITPWLTSLASSKIGLKLPEVDQFFGWSIEGFPVHTYFAAPTSGASNQVQLLSESLMNQGNAWLATHGMGQFERSPGGNSVAWMRLPMVQAFLRPVVETNSGEFIFGGWLPYKHTNQPPPAEMLQMLFNRTNLIAYEWEITQPRVEGWLLFGQTLRLALFKAQLPAGSTSMVWLKNTGLKLGNSVTAVNQTGPAQISLIRQSTVGATSVELHLLTDWFESPQFPVGLHTFLAPEAIPPWKKYTLPPKSTNP